MKAAYRNIKTFASKGFTLIELLVVIGILAILATALIATLDPFEQMRRAQDSNLKTMAAEFVSATARYYTVHNALPWFDTASNGANCYSGGTTLSAISLTTMRPCLDTLVAEGELKQGFATSNNLSLLVATNPNPQTASDTDTIVCFKPQSKAQQKDAGTKYNEDGTSANNCKSQSPSGGSDCYWCSQAQ